ncbi:MAG: hypothetical protein GTO45_38310 [Candidatus Aminicenantes bacterium]|nr:hypothetical protein [Candidatus Aminicenantes bacterium]NIM84479.1 hypothetical protein [Candidatus Aminicenantes bacterium]NIN24000.1 hypothetical protein [Candidatus Aminicenantes bacterium]NIN47714.1 hypothetical protein [Candidatus Aminicenantes bacterium]NIN90644.1 hypothetical protein [Candidatus Aminicenantes bacterium]
MNIQERISRLSPERRKLLEKKLNSLAAKKKQQVISAPTAPIEPAEEKEYYPLSSSQKRLYILNLFLEYTMSLAFEVEGKPDRGRFQQAFRELVERHEGLRTSFAEIDGKPVQRIHQKVNFEIEYYDPGTGHWAPGNGVDVKELFKHFFRPFDLSKPPLLRVGLIKLTETRHLFLVNMHHIISDGVSRGLLAREFIRLYGGEELPELRVRYRDFSEWENRWFKPKEYKKQEKYWCGLFSGGIPLLNMPTDYPRPEIQSFEGSRLHFEIEGEMFQKLKTLALGEGTSLYMVLLAVTNILLFRYTGQEDIVIGTIAAGRVRWELQNLIGVFVNPLPIRNYPANSKTFSEFLKELKHKTLKAFENQLYPFGDMIETLIKKKDLSRNPLFDVMFIFRNRDIEKEEVDGLHFTRYEMDREFVAHAQQDITFWAVEEEDRTRIEIAYCTALFKQETMEEFSTFFEKIMSSVIENKDIKIEDIKIPLYLGEAASSVVQAEDIQFGF